MNDHGYQIEVDQITPKEWSESLDMFEDANIYQTWPFGSVRWGERSLSHLLLKRDHMTVAMAQLRIVRPCQLKFGMAHLRSGPLLQLGGSQLDPDIAARMASALYEEYVQKRRLFLRILPNAFAKTPRALALQKAFSQYKSKSFAPGDSFRTLVLDLKPPLEELRKRLDQKWRNQLNRAERNGLTVQEGEGPEHFQNFIAIYNEMWSRKRFSKSSDVREFARMQDSLSASQRMRVFLATQAGIGISGVVATGIGNTGIYLFGATSDQGLKAKGAYLLQWRVIQWLKEIGAKYYNLGGINPQTNPGVYHFKAGLSGADVLYSNPMVACESLGSRALSCVTDLARGPVRHTLDRLCARK